MLKEGTPVKLLSFDKESLGVRKGCEGRVVNVIDTDTVKVRFDIHKIGVIINVNPSEILEVRNNGN